MRYSQIFVPTLKQPPSDADNVSIKLMSRAGMIRKLAGGLYEWLPVGLRVLKKVENIIREEMNRAGGQEISLPILQPRELWEETGRWGVYGKELFRLKDRKNSDFCLGPTHEEVITDIVRRDVRSYKELPLMFYQFGTKFRDEIRPRFGVMRAREFLMKDAYSFHASEDDAEKYYLKVFDAYKRICDRCGFDYRAVEAATGAIGGRHSHEFMVLASTGEELIAHCACGYGANVEKAECVFSDAPEAPAASPESLKEVHTPRMRSVEEVGGFLNLAPEKFIKTLIYKTQDKVVMVLIRGDRVVNEAKLSERLGSAEVELAMPDVVAEITGAAAGFAGPVPKNQKIDMLLADNSVRSIVNAVSGANKTDYHLTGINIGRDYAPDDILDLALVSEGDVCPRCRREKLSFSRGIEVGHTFKLGKKYSEALNAVFLNADGKQVHFIMGCYGIGVSRMVAAAIEQSSDADGIIWPANIAPYHAVVIPVDTADEKIMAAAVGIYDKMSASGADVVLDDRPERPGVKFKDADLIGFPVRLTVGKKLPEGLVELRLRKEKTSADVPVAEAAEAAIEAIGHSK